MPTVSFTVKDGIGSASGRRDLFFRSTHLRHVDGAIISTKSGDEPGRVPVVDGQVVELELAEGPWQVSGLDYYGVGTIDFTVPPEGGDLWDLIALEIGLPKPSNTEQVRAAVQAWLDDNAPDDLLSKADADNTYAPLWKPSTVYTAGTKVISPTTGDVISRNSNGTSRATFDATEQGLWTSAYTTPAFIRRDRPMAATDPIFDIDAAGTSDATAAIQALLDEALAEKRIVEFPRGWYRISQITVPSKVKVVGHYIGGYASNATEAGTYFLHEAGSTGPMIVFTGNADGGRINIGPVSISGIAMRGTPANVNARAFAFQAADGTLGTIQDTVLMSELLIRGFSAGGGVVPAGARPMHFRDINLLFNGGIGLDYLQPEANLTQAVHFDNISGDGNIGGLVRCKGVDANGSLLFTNIKSERRINSMFGNVAGQESALVFEDCADTAVAIHGLTHVSSIPNSPTFEPPGPAIAVRGTGTPRISWSGVAVRVRSNDTVATVKPAVLKDERTGGVVMGIRETHGSYPVPRRANDDTITGAITTMARSEISSDSVPLGTAAQPNQVVHLTYFTPVRDASITAARTIVGDIASSGDATLQSIGIMQVADNGDLTRLGTTGGTSLWTSAGGRGNSAFSTAVELKAGQRYAVALLTVGATTVARFTGAVAGNANELAEAPRKTGQLTGTSQIPATVLAASVGNTKSRIYTALVG